MSDLHVVVLLVAGVALLSVIGSRMNRPIFHPCPVCERPTLPSDGVCPHCGSDLGRE